MFKNELLNGEIKFLENKRNALLIELKLLDKQLTEKNKSYHSEKKKYYFEKGLCGSCYYKLSDDDIKYKTIYCKECCENDSVLDWNSNLHN